MKSTSDVAVATLAPFTLELTTAERDQANLYLTQTRNGMVGAIKGLSLSQWRFSPDPESWSAAQIAEHVILILRHVGGPLQELLAQAPPASADRDHKHVDSIVIHQFPTRLTKFPSPAVVCPAGTLGSPRQAIEVLDESYSRLFESLERTPDLRAHAIEAAPLRAVTCGQHTLMDGYQWILAAAAHADRHTKQILEVKADSNFPAN